jgi:hypothetical protein
LRSDSMIVIEGADLVGKTTLCEALLKDQRLSRAGFVYQHLGRLSPNFDHWLDYDKLMGPCMVRDRFHMSEVVYAGVTDRPSSMCPEAYRVVDAKLRLLGALVVTCYVEPWTVEYRLKRSPQEPFNLEQIQHVNASYRIVAHGGTLNFPKMGGEYRMDCDMPVQLDTHSLHHWVDVVLKAYQLRQAQVWFRLHKRAQEGRWPSLG